MEYVDLEKYAARMQELKNAQPEMKPHRLRSERSRLMYDMLRILKPSLHRLTLRKNMTSALRDEIEQHAAIAITRAIEDWDAEKATFSTYVHWKILAELQTLQWVEFPDRRKLMLQQPLRFLELDRPMRGSEGDDDFTLGQTLVAANAEEDVECTAREHIAMHCFERVFSHYIVKQMHSYRSNQSDQEKIELRQSSLMRNRWIYICRVIHMETCEVIAKRHNITRERVRQVIKKIDEDLRGQLPRYCKDTDRVIHATRQPPENIHDEWDAMLIAFYMETGIDSRLVNHASPLPTRPSEKPGAEIKVVAEEVQVENVERPVRDNVIEISRRRPVQLSLFKGAGFAVAAGAALMSASAGAQSKAIPPVSAPKTSPEPLTVAAVEARTAKTEKEGVKGFETRTSRIRAVEKIVTSRPTWGVRLASYPKLDALKTAAVREQRAWPWLRGLSIAYAGEKGRYQAVFGPLSKDQASGLCHEAKRHDRACSVVKYGTAGL